AVGAHHDTTAVRFPVSRSPDDSRDGPMVQDQVLDGDTLAHLRAGAPGRGQENRVERGPWQGETVGTGTAAEPAAHGGPAGRDHFHPVQLGMSGALYRGEDIRTEALQYFCGRGAQILGTRFVAGEPGAVEEQHRRAGAGEQQRRRRSGRPGSDHDGIPAVGHDVAASTAVAAPTTVAARFTPSLSSHRQPRASRTGSWHTVLPRSNRASHAGHSYLPCSVAPKTESTSMPNTPAPVRIANPGAAPRGPKT